jgi:hypothetical protein
VDEFMKNTWIFLSKSKDPPIQTVELFLKANGRTAGGNIRCDQGGELASCTEFVTTMALYWAILGYDVEPTGADSPDQNKGAEKWNDTLAVTVHVLLYGSGLSAEYWSAALVHAAFLHNRLVHKSTMMIPFQAWYGFKPDLQNLCIFGSCVCVKRTGKHRSKLDRDLILRDLDFIPTVNEPCLYSGLVDGLRCIFKCQVDDCGIASPSRHCADILFDALDEPLQIPIK